MIFGKIVVFFFLAVSTGLDSFASESACLAPSPDGEVPADSAECEARWRRQVGLELTNMYSEIARRSDDLFRQRAVAAEEWIDYLIGVSSLAAAGVSATSHTEFSAAFVGSIAELVIDSMPVEDWDDAFRRETLSFVNTAIAESIKTGGRAASPAGMIVASADLTNKVAALIAARQELQQRNTNNIAYEILNKRYSNRMSMEEINAHYDLGPNASLDDLIVRIAELYVDRGTYDATEAAEIVKQLDGLVDTEWGRRRDNARLERDQASFAGATGPGLSVAVEEPLEEAVQKDRRQEICDRYRSGAQVVTGARMVAEVRGLTGYDREKSIRCMRPKQSFVISPAELLQLVYGMSAADRKGFLCSFRENLPTPQDARTIAVLLGDLSGYSRETAITCLRTKLEESSLSVDSALQILGNLMPEQYEGWDETLADYDPGHHLDSLCQLSNYLKRDLTPADAATLLGQSRNYGRRRGVNCIREAIAHGLTWEGVDVILGPSISNRGDMIDALEERTPDGLNARKLREFMDRYRHDRYLNDPDPPKWLNGQCIAFARLAYQQVTGNPLAIQFGQASNIVNRTASAGLATEADPKKARVGALAVWDDGGAGHVGVVVGIRRDDKTGLANRIQVAESNWGVVTSTVTKTWGLSIEEAKRELVSDQYGYFSTVTLETDSLDRPPPRAKEPLSYKFIGYVLP